MGRAHLLCDSVCYQVCVHNRYACVSQQPGDGTFAAGNAACQPHKLHAVKRTDGDQTKQGWLWRRRCWSATEACAAVQCILWRQIKVKDMKGEDFATFTHKQQKLICRRGFLLSRKGNTLLRHWIECVGA
jgi:hypothetical protein